MTDWSRVEDAVPHAKGICWDGCHKIYVLMDAEQVRLSESYGYDVIVVPWPTMLVMLREWYDASCGLRFIEAVRTVEDNPNDGFDALIPQGADWEDE